MKKRFVAAFTDLSKLSSVGQAYAVEFKGMYFVRFLDTHVSSTSRLFELAHSIFPHKGNPIKSYDGSVKRADIDKLPSLQSHCVDNAFFSIV